MHFSHALILTFIATATAQTGTIEGDVAALPACAKTCLDKATLAAGCKSITGSSLFSRCCSCRREVVCSVVWMGMRVGSLVWMRGTDGA